MKDNKTSLLFLLLAVLLITLFSCCSWIYPLQPYDDANWYMDIGRSMLSGKLLYTDVHDQKGPLLFFLHEWAAMLSPRSFLGIYLVEILCAFGFLTLSYRTMRLFAKHDISLITTCAVGILTYTSDFMWYGDTVEELSLPILLFVLHKTLRYAKLGELPKDRESAFIGVGIAVIFWMKFTVLAMCMGALAALSILAWRRRQLSLLLQCLAWVIAGAGGLTACVLLYFVVHGNEADLYHSYFYINIFLYTEAGKIDASAAWWPVKLTGWLLLVSFVLTRRMQRDIKLTVVLCWGAELLTFVLLRVFLYYFLTVFVFAPLVVYFVRMIHNRKLLIAGAALSSAFAFLTNYNLMTLLSGCFPQAVLHLAETVDADKDPEKEILTVKSYDTGIYMLTDGLPPIKYFCTPNTYIPELVQEQTAYLKSCQAKYLIQKTGDASKYYDSFHPDLERDYTLIQEVSNAYRTEFLLHPLEFLWSLGYMKGFIEYFHTPEHRLVTYQLWRLKHTESLNYNAEKLTGDWEMCLEGGSRHMLSFSKHNLVRCREYAKDSLERDKTYSYTFHDGELILGYMFTGEEYRNVKVVGMSQTQLVLYNWPMRGKCSFTRQK